jgi:hypothetical protein
MVKGWRVRKMIQGCRFCLLGLKKGRNDINMALNPTMKKISGKLQHLPTYV